MLLASGDTPIAQHFGTILERQWNRFWNQASVF
jgi:hypothetical protein